jgi:hypothetical protein
VPFDLSRDIVLRCPDQDREMADLLRQGAIDVALVGKPKGDFSKACQPAGIRVAPASELAVSDLSGFRAAAGLQAALAGGVWPGIGREPTMHDVDEIAGASRQPWLDANGFRVAWLRALCPSRPPALAYLPDQAAGVGPERIVPYETLELALAEAWINGGNYVMALEARYHEALRRGDARALAAWRDLGRTARWLKQNRGLFGRPVFPRITQLVDAGEATAEIANLLCRQNASPALEPAASPPPPDPTLRAVVVAASLEPPPPEVRGRILAHAAAGATLVTDREQPEPWWKTSGLRLQRDEQDREIYSLGSGTLVAYKEKIVDPSDFALDVIDLATQPRRAVRIWDAMAVIATLTAAPSEGPHRGRALLHAINYGRPFDSEMMVYVQGAYSGALLLRPEAGPLPLKTTARGVATELTLPGLHRVASVLLN